MSEAIRQVDHFFSVGDKVVLVKGDYKKASWHDALHRNQMYKITEVIDKNVFKLMAIRKGI